MRTDPNSATFPNNEHYQKNGLTKRELFTLVFLYLDASKNSFSRIGDSDILNAVQGADKLITELNKGGLNNVH